MNSRESGDTYSFPSYRPPYTSFLRAGDGVEVCVPRLQSTPDLPLAERVAGVLCQIVLHAASLRCSHRGRTLLQIILGVERRAVNSIRGRVRKGSGGLGLDAVRGGAAVWDEQVGGSLRDLEE
jgi:hypothetical protein